MQIQISTIPHKSQRYDTVGDWQFFDLDDTEAVLDITVSNMQNEDYEFLVGIHEAIEAYLCKKRNIQESDVTAFDIRYEQERAEGKHGYTSEPGDDPDAPYYYEHKIATKIEQMLAKELKIDWNEYDEAVNSL